MEAIRVTARYPPYLGTPVVVDAERNTDLLCHLMALLMVTSFLSLVNL